MKLMARIVEHWGKRHRIMPILIDRIWGNGKKLIWLTPLNTRPNYYLIRIHSSTNINHEKFWNSLLLNEIFEEIEDNFGPCRGPRGAMIPFPSLDLDCGYSWGKEDDEKIMKEVRKLNA